MAKAARTAARPKAGDKAKSPAEWAHDRLVLCIRHFESRLDAAEEIAMGFAGDASA